MSHATMTLKAALGQIALAAGTMLAIMQREYIVLGNLDDRMQKMAFTLYSKLVECSVLAEETLEQHDQMRLALKAKRCRRSQCRRRGSRA